MRIVATVGMVVLLSGCNMYRDQVKFASVDDTPSKALVQLRVGENPSAALVSVHCWFCGYDPATKTWHRWDVSEEADGSKHVRKDHMKPAEWMRPSWIQTEWKGARAEQLIAVLNDPSGYSFGEEHGSWLGPNANSFVRWAVREAGASVDLPARANGKDFLGYIGGVGVTTTRTGLQFETLPFGFAFGLLDGVEIHLMGMTFGVDLIPPGIMSPLGRLGLPE